MIIFLTKYAGRNLVNLLPRDGPKRLRTDLSFVCGLIMNSNEFLQQIRYKLHILILHALHLVNIKVVCLIFLFVFCFFFSSSSLTTVIYQRHKNLRVQRGNKRKEKLRCTENSSCFDIIFTSWNNARSISIFTLKTMLHFHSPIYFAIMTLLGSSHFLS